MQERTRLQIAFAFACVVGLLASLTVAPAALGAPPGNDNFASATAVTNPTVGVPTTLLSQTTVEATAETNEPAHAGSAANNSVWYSFTPDARGLYAFHICNTGAKLAVYTGDAVNSLTEVASGVFPGGCSSSNGVQFVATAGTSYHLVVDTFVETSFTFRLVLLQLAPPNDNFASPTVLPGTSFASLLDQTTEIASAEPNEPAHAGKTATNSVWYSFSPDATGVYKLSTCGIVNTVLAVYEGTAIGALTGVASNDDGPSSCSSTNAAFEFAATSGVTYRVALDSYAPGKQITLRSELLPDADGDGVSDSSDNCPNASNPGQENTKGGTAAGDACEDQDADGVVDAGDSCTTQAGPASNGGCPLPLVTTPVVTPTTAPFDLAGAIKKCKKKFRPGKKRRKCMRKAKARA